jgi:hypothetical protein
MGYRLSPGAASWYRPVKCPRAIHDGVQKPQAHLGEGLRERLAARRGGGDRERERRRGGGARRGGLRLRE